MNVLLRDGQNLRFETNKPSEMEPSMIFRRTRVLPAGDPPMKNRKIIRGRNRIGDLGIILPLAYLVGIPLPSLSLLTKRKTVSACINFWILLVIVFRTLLYVFQNVYYNLLWPTVALRFCSILHCFSGYAMIFVFAVNRNKITAAITKIMSLSHFLNSNSVRKKSFIPVQLLFCFLVTGVLLWTGIIFFYYTAWEPITANIKPYVPFAENSALYHYYNWMIMFSFLVTYYSSSVTLYTTVLLCAYMYRSSGLLFVLYRNKLRAEAENKRLTSSSALDNLRLFKKIVHCVKAVDRALGVSALVVYIAVINNFFILLVVFISSNKTFTTVGVQIYLILSSVFALVKFLLLTFSGDCVPQYSDALKKELLPLSGAVIQQSPDESTTLVYNQLLNCIRSTQACVTGFGFFNITKRLIPAVVGVMITYGVLIYQIGGHIDS